MTAKSGAGHFFNLKKFNPGPPLIFPTDNVVTYLLCPLICNVLSLSDPPAAMPLLQCYRVVI